MKCFVFLWFIAAYSGTIVADVRTGKQSRQAVCVNLVVALSLTLMGVAGWFIWEAL